MRPTPQVPQPPVASPALLDSFLLQRRAHLPPLHQPATTRSNIKTLRVCITLMYTWITAALYQYQYCPIGCKGFYSSSPWHLARFACRASVITLSRSHPSQVQASTHTHDVVPRLHGEETRIKYTLPCKPSHANQLFVLFDSRAAEMLSFAYIVYICSSMLHRVGLCTQ